MRRIEFTLRGETAWVDVLDPSEVSVKARRTLRAVQSSALGAMGKSAKAFASLGDEPPETADQAAKDSYAERMIEVVADAHLTPEDHEAMFLIDQRALMTIIKAWSLPDPISMDTLDDMTAGDYDALSAALKAPAKDVLANADVDFSVTPITPGEPLTPTRA